MKRLILNFLKPSFGRKRMQAFYERLLRLSLKGMNYGNGGDYKTSGELHALHYVKERLGGENPIVAFDVGANVGHYSRALADIFDNRIIIYCFEPSKKTFSRLLDNTAAIRSIIPNNFGFSDIDRSLILYSSHKASGLASVYKRDLGSLNIALDEKEEVKLKTIDHYCAENNIEKIHFLKLDIEGHEFSALQGAERMLREGRIDFIQFEFGGTSIDSRTYFRDFFDLLSNRYRLYRVLKDGFWDIPRYNIHQEIFSSINYFAQRSTNA